ncbi:MAG: hypothetical protein R3236_11920, partial [Phycisphaeraceae bacterium]|nr:hypothetical protein [Phycisphaeraceae bacterium]
MHRMRHTATLALVLIILLGGCQSEETPPAEGPPGQAPKQVLQGADNIRLTSRLPYALNKNKLDSGIVFGEAAGRPNALLKGSGSVQSNDKPPGKLAVAHVAHPENTAVVRLELGSGTSGDLLHMLRQRTGEPSAPMLVDVNGRSYHATGYVVRSGEGFSFFFDPKKPLRRLSDLNIGAVGPG